MYDGKKLKTFVEYINPNEVLDGLWPKIGLTSGGKVIIIGTAGELDKHDLKNFDGMWFQRVVPSEEVIEQYGINLPEGTLGLYNKNE